MFDRRTPKPILQRLRDFLYPRMGWGRALRYLSHRIKRIPDSPSKIARGLAVGVFVTFTPLFGLHFPAAALLAYIVRANVLAALIATFFGNPLTFPIIGWVSFKLGAWMMDLARDERSFDYIRRETGDAIDTLWTNFKSLFGYQPTPWDRFGEFMETIFVPYFIGGLIPGLIFGTAVFYLSKPVIAAYQNRRKGRLKAKFLQLREAAIKAAKDRTNGE